MSNVQGVVFDFDGVVCNSEALHYDACIHALEQEQIKFSYETYTARYVGLPDHIMFPTVLEDHGRAIDLTLLRTLNARKVNYYQTAARNQCLRACPGFVNFFQKIAGGVKRAICTSAKLSEVESALPHIEHGLAPDWFDAITTIDEVDMGKPAPDGYLLTVQKLGLEPARCFAVEDSPVGITAAHEAGLSVIAITTTHPKERLQEADCVVSSLNSSSLKPFFKHVWQQTH